MNHRGHDPRADAPNAWRYLVIPVSPTLAPAYDRIMADFRRRNPQASEAQLEEQMAAEVVVLMDARIPKPASREAV